MEIVVSPNLDMLEALKKSDVKIDNGWFWTATFKHKGAMLVASSLKASKTELSCKRKASKYIRSLFVDEKVDVVFDSCVTYRAK